MYIELSPKKTYAFLGFMLCLAVALFVSASYVRTLPAEYTRLKSITTMAAMPFRALQYGLDYTSQGAPNSFLLAAADNFFTPAKLEVNVATRTPAVDIPVLLYHGITEPRDRFSMPADTFTDQMFALKKAGYHTITLKDFEAWMKGEKELDNKSILVTFDDARLDAYWGADPVLQGLGFNAVMYVATADSIEVNRPLPSYYIHEGLLGRMLRSGRWELGSHAIQQTGGFIPIDAEGTKANFLSNKMWLETENRLETDEEYRARIVQEIGESKKILEKTFGAPITTLAYPFGDYGQQTVNYPRAQAVITDIINDTYDFAFRQVWPGDTLYTSNYRSDDRFHLHRIESGTDWTGDDLLEVLDQGRTKPLPYSDDFQANNGWKYNWGNASIGDGKIRLWAATSTTGSITFLDGSHEWTDYFYAVSAERNAGQYVSLISRFQNESNYVTCWFSDDQVKITEKHNGAVRTLAQERNPIQDSVNAASLGMSVAGNVVRCFEGSRIITLANNLSPDISKGGIAFSVWDPAMNIADASIMSLDVASPETAAALRARLPLYPLK
jgi:peptidoglycan/xylan/chitin deacetylase (PgdA/CDA1 family)